MGIPAWVWALAVGWSGVLVGAGVRLYRTRCSWMRKYREDHPKRETIWAVRVDVVGPRM